MKKCFEKLGLVIRPIGKKWKEKVTVMKIRIDENPEIIKVNDIRYFPNETGKERNVSIFLEKGFYINEDNQNFNFSTELPIFIDASVQLDFKAENEKLDLYKFDSSPQELEADFMAFINKKPIKKGKQTHKVELPYKGNILVKKGDTVTPDTIIGENMYDPPRVYVISLFDKTYLHLNPDNIEKSIRIKEGEEVKYGQRIAEIGDKTFLKEIQFQHYYFDSPVRGRVEKINFDSGTIIMREIQDPKMITRYMKKSLNDFVYAGESVASKIIDVQGSGFPMIVSAPTTGTIKKIDTENGTVTIQYDKDPYYRFAGINGKITEIEPELSVIISYEGSTLMGIIGFGSESWGKIKYLENVKNIRKCGKEDIVIIPAKIDIPFLKKAEKKKVKGVIAASIDNKDLVEFIGEDIGVALTGNENIPFPLIITEGFGNFEMDKDYNKFFKEHDGNMIYINGHTQIRAGVTRPKMIVMDK
jgi:biotin carboxyl carrier protein